MSEFIDDVQLRITAALCKMGISETVAGMVAAEISGDIARCWRGQAVYVSDRSRLHEEVRRCFNGRNAREIARELGVGRATVYRILKTPG